VSVERGGKDLVRVADDGKGMAPRRPAARLRPRTPRASWPRPTTCSDRDARVPGEALAAIAEVSKVRCQTRQADAATGSEIVIEGGVASPVRDCGGPPGTVIEVRNLFYNTPVRRTYLKADATEAGHVAEMFSRIALAHPTVHLTYRSSGKVVHDLPPVTGIKERVAGLLRA
jgi:DNA mismatch repair protein MutL